MEKNLKAKQAELSTPELQEPDNPLIQYISPPILAGPPPKMMLAPLSPALGSAHSPSYRSQSIPQPPEYSHPPEPFVQDWQQQRDAEDTRRAGLLQHSIAGGTTSAFKHAYGQEQSHQSYQPLPQNNLPHDASSAASYPTPNPYAPGPSRVTASSSSSSQRRLQDVPPQFQPQSLPPYLSTYDPLALRRQYSSDGSQANTPSTLSNSSAYTAASSIEGDWDQYGPLPPTLQHPTSIQPPQHSFSYAPATQYTPPRTFHPADPRGGNSIANRSIAVPTHYPGQSQQNDINYYSHYAAPSDNYTRRADLPLPNCNESGVQQYGGASGPIYDNPGWAPQYGGEGSDSHQSGRGKKRRMEY